MVFGFGLFHGLGFASVLAEMGIHSNYTILTLLGFNIGVELGQLTIVIVTVPVLYFARTLTLYTRVGMPAAATALLIISTYWFVERAFNVDLPAGSIVNELLAMI